MLRRKAQHHMLDYLAVILAQALVTRLMTSLASPMNQWRIGRPIRYKMITTKLPILMCRLKLRQPKFFVVVKRRRSWLVDKINPVKLSGRITSMILQMVHQIKVDIIHYQILL
ncbi:hypothetical protein MJO29_002310 [Puccinia striiformis f. sp. tritici]|nr:hypothetical protein MJO29_003335 [Puccinia striiformis f. sp. tritici]KAI7966562.1 hypothetical protein MJO29_002310 [Puccinia striiformis f. sp. tritici]